MFINEKPSQDELKNIADDFDYIFLDSEYKKQVQLQSKDLNHEDIIDLKQAHGYTASHFPNQGFYFLGKDADEIKYGDNFDVQTRCLIKGWKLHISIDDNNMESGNLEKAWKVIVSHLIWYGVKEFKIVDNDSRKYMQNGKGQEGKQVTIYAYKNHFLVEQWQNIIQSIEQGLADQHITSGPTPKSRNKYQEGQDETVICGSHFFIVYLKKKMIRVTLNILKMFFWILRYRYIMKIAV